MEFKRLNVYVLLIRHLARVLVEPGNECIPVEKKYCTVELAIGWLNVVVGSRAKNIQNIPVYQLLGTFIRVSCTIPFYFAMN